VITLEVAEPKTPLTSALAWTTGEKRRKAENLLPEEHGGKMRSQPAGCTLPRPENRPGEAGEPGTPLVIRVESNNGYSDKDN